VDIYYLDPMDDKKTPFATSVLRQFHGILRGLFHHLDRAAYGFVRPTADWGGRVSFPDLPQQADATNCGTVILLFLCALLRQGKGLFELEKHSPHPVARILNELNQFIPQQHRIHGGVCSTSLCDSVRSYWASELEAKLPSLLASNQQQKAPRMDTKGRRPLDLKPVPSVS